MFLFANDNLERFHFRQPWPMGMLFLFVVAVLLLAGFLYWRETTLAAWKRIMLAGLRVLIFLVIALVLWEPVSAIAKKTKVPNNIIVLVDVSESMSFADKRQSDDDLTEAAIALGKLPFAGKLLPDSLRREVAEVPRIDLARAIVLNPELKVLNSPSDNYRLNYFAFGKELEAVPGGPKELRDWISKVKPDAPGTALGNSLLEVSTKFSGMPVAGVVVLTDGGSNVGRQPLDVVKKLGAPVYAVGIGTAKPPDVKLLENIVMPETIFPKDKVPILVQIESTKEFAGREVELSAKSGGRVLASEKITLIDTSKKPHFEELSFVPEQTSGRLELEIAVSPLPGEADLENNRVKAEVKIIDDRIKVLYVEGRPRWEFRYLRSVLLRDRRMSVKFLLTEGDPDLAKASEQYIDKLPEDEKSTLDYDMVILGEVPSSYFKKEQLQWLEKLVNLKEGSLLMLGGTQHAPASYAGTPIENLLPVILSAGGRITIDEKVHPVITKDGLKSQIMSLASRDDENLKSTELEEKSQEIWKRVQPLHDLPRLNGVRPGATVLATLSNEADQAKAYPLISWQRYGGGMSMFVATDQLWRLRLKRGDAYHAHFWGQAIQYLAASRLQGANKRVRIETSAKKYKTGDRILIQATAYDEEMRPLKEKSLQVLVEHDPPKGEPKVVTLKAVANYNSKKGSDQQTEADKENRPTLYQDYLMAEQEGRFLVRAVKKYESSASRAMYRITPSTREMQDPGLKEKELRDLANATGGLYLTARDLPKLQEKLSNVEPREVSLPPQETELWNHWWVFALILSLAGVEWFVRRSSDVA